MCFIKHTHKTRIKKREKVQCLKILRRERNIEFPSLSTFSREWNLNVIFLFWGVNSDICTYILLPIWNELEKENEGFISCTIWFLSKSKALITKSLFRIIVYYRPLYSDSHYVSFCLKTSIAYWFELFGQFTWHGTLIIMMFQILDTSTRKKKSKMHVQFVAKLVLVRAAWKIHLKTVKVRSESDIIVAWFVIWITHIIN